MVAQLFVTHISPASPPDEDNVTLFTGNRVIVI